MSTAGQSSAAADKGFQTIVGHPARNQWRYAKDRIASVAVSLGGLSVIFAVVLIFFYLLWVVLPLFKPADMQATQRYVIPGNAAAPSLYYGIEEQAEIGLRISENGQLRFFELDSGKLMAGGYEWAGSLQAVTEVDGAKGVLAVHDESGQVQILRHRYKLDYPEAGGRIITPVLEFPYGQTGFELPGGQALAVRDDDNKLTAASASGNVISLRQFRKASSFLSDDVELEESASLQLDVHAPVDELLIDPLQEWLYAFNYSGGELYFYDIRRLPEVQLREAVKLGAGERITAAAMLAGGISVIAASSEGRIIQWFPLRDAVGDYSLQQVRSFRAPGADPVHALIVEQSRRGFMALDASGHVGVYYATSEREVMSAQLGESALRTGAVAPRANTMLLEYDDGHAQVVKLHNEHPEVSWKALWGKIWYESYPEPQQIWQSSAANSDFEPKFSLAPLSFGTLKAAFYAMLFAVPLAIGGAIFTAYFMAPAMRQKVKPTIEVMEALPTVILGFLAGLWLAPFVEQHLPGIFLMLIFVIVVMPVSGWLWIKMPQSLRYRVPAGWQPALLILPIVAAAGLALVLSGPIELLFFNGSMPQWLSNEMGITYDQRNSLVVGLAMGFAVIPTIFSIAEDAIFSVPKQLTQGSLALGASPWQTLIRVILPTASPGIFSALMIGMGRAVGETMIVLMATGNTPIMDFNIFEGFRTLSANIAVEMPESEVGSTHYRILFLAGLVLFLFTFVFNTIAEVVRQRLRTKYSNL